MTLVSPRLRRPILIVPAGSLMICLSPQPSVERVVGVIPGRRKAAPPSNRLSRAPALEADTLTETDYPRPLYAIPYKRYRREPNSASVAGAKLITPDHTFPSAISSQP